MYRTIKERVEEVIGGEYNFIANAANVSSLISCGLKDINWAGFYMANNDELILGPFNGKLACVRIPYGKGVCGTAAKLRKSIIVDDVCDFPGHIACDPRSKSEIVIPLINDGVFYGVLDVDSPITKRFGEEDRIELENLVGILMSASDMISLSNYYEIKQEVY